MEALKQFKSDCIDKLFEDFKPDYDYSFYDFFMRKAKEGMVCDPTNMCEDYLSRVNNGYAPYEAFSDYECSETIFMSHAQDFLMFTSEEVHTHGGEWVRNVLAGGIPEILGNAYSEFIDQIYGFTRGFDETILYKNVLEDYGVERSVNFIKQIGNDNKELGISDKEFNSLAKYIVCEYIPTKLDHNLDMVIDLCHNIKSDRLLTYMLSDMLNIDDDVHFTIEAELHNNLYLSRTDNCVLKERAKEIFTKYKIDPNWTDITSSEGKKSVSASKNRQDRSKRGMVL